MDALHADEYVKGGAYRAPGSFFARLVRTLLLSATLFVSSLG